MTAVQPVRGLTGATYSGYGSAFFNVKDVAYGAVGNGIADDTVAIQAAIDACAAAGGGTVYFPDGTYLVGGALVTTGSYCTQLKIPLLGLDKTIKFCGSRRANNFGDSPGPGNGAIIKSTSTGQTYATSSKLPSVLGGPASKLPFTTSFTDTRVEIENLAIKCPTNPKIAALDLGGVYQAQLVGVQVYTEGYPITVQPTQKEGVGIVMPAINNYTGNILDGVSVIGFYCGVVAGEHISAPFLHVDSCFIAMSWWPMVYSVVLSMFDMERCTHGFAFSDFSASGGPASASSAQPGTFLVEQWDIEHQTSGWNTFVDHVNDVNTNALQLRVLNFNDNTDGYLTVASGARVFAQSMDNPAVNLTRAYRFSTNQSIASGSDVVITLTANSGRVLNPGVDFDTGHNSLAAWASGNPTRLTAPASGVYRVIAQIGFAHSATTMSQYLKIRSNGAATRATVGGLKIPSDFDTFWQASFEHFFFAGSYVEMLGFQNSGGVLDVLKDDTFMTMTRIA